MSLAGPGRDLAATLPASAFNAGIAVGALAGGWAVASYSVSSVFLVGLVICIVALPVAWATSFLKPAQESGTSPSPAAEATAEADYSVMGHTSGCQVVTAAADSPRPDRRQ